MGSMCVLHASFTEYLLLFGTAVDTGGHSGEEVKDQSVWGGMQQNAFISFCFSILKILLLASPASFRPLLG